MNFTARPYLKPVKKKLESVRPSTHLKTPVPGLSAADARPTIPAPMDEELERHDTIPAPPWLDDTSDG